MDTLSYTQIWLIVAALALIAELMSVGFVFLFFSIGGLVTALLSWLGIIQTINMQLLCFSFVSIASLIALRKPMQQFFNKNSKTVPYNEYIGDSAIAITDIPANGEGRVFFRGTEWSATSIAETDVINGSKVIVKKLDGIRLIVE